MAAVLYWTRCPSPWGPLRLLATEQGLCRLALPGEGELDRWVARHLGERVLVEGSALLAEAAAQLEDYLAGRRRNFDLPLDLRGTPFQRAVWWALAEIPYGQVRSYAQVAQTIGRPRATRAVGAAVGANPLPILLPCHRVVRADGSLGWYGGGVEMKRALLEREGCIGPPFVLEYGQSDPADMKG